MVAEINIAHIYLDDARIKKYGKEVAIKAACQALSVSEAEEVIYCADWLNSSGYGCSSHSFCSQECSAKNSQDFAGWLDEQLQPQNEEAEAQRVKKAFQSLLNLIASGRSLLLCCHCAPRCYYAEVMAQRLQQEICAELPSGALLTWGLEMSTAGTNDCNNSSKNR